MPYCSPPAVDHPGYCRPAGAGACLRGALAGVGGASSRDASRDASRDGCGDGSACAGTSGRRARSTATATATIDRVRRCSYARCRQLCEQYRRGVAPRDGVNGLSHDSRSHTGAAAGGGEVSSVIRPTVSRSRATSGTPHNQYGRPRHIRASSPHNSRAVRGTPCRLERTNLRALPVAVVY